VTLGCLLG